MRAVEQAGELVGAFVGGEDEVEDGIAFHQHNLAGVQIDPGRVACDHDERERRALGQMVRQGAAVVLRDLDGDHAVVDRAVLDVHGPRVARDVVAQREEGVQLERRDVVLGADDRNGDRRRQRGHGLDDDAVREHAAARVEGAVRVQEAGEARPEPRRIVVAGGAVIEDRVALAPPG